MKKCLVLAVILVFSSCGVAAKSVKVYEGKRQILTGPGGKKPPQLRRDEFKPVDHFAVYIENEYFRCCALPQIGGRLYEVYNKITKTQVFFVNPYLEQQADDKGGAWNLGGVEVNFPYFHHGNTYNDRWQWARVRQDDGSAGIVMSYTSRPTMQRVSFRVLLRPGVARVDLAYRFENLNPYSWGLAAWINTMHPRTMETEFIMPSRWMAQHGHNAFRTDVLPWPVRNGVDLSWMKNLPGGLSEFSWMPRRHFTGCYDHALDRGAVRIFDPATLPAVKLCTSSPPVLPEQYFQHFEIWTATSPVMEDPTRQPEFSSYTGADSWYQVWGIGGYVYANDDLALNLRREQDGSVVAGVCGVRKIPGCVAAFMAGPQTLRREVFTLDPASPKTWKLAAPPGDITMDVIAPDGKTLAHYERIETEQPVEQWQMNKEPRWRSGINKVYYQEYYPTLWRRRHSFQGAIGGYRQLLKKEPESTKLMLDLARVYLKDQQVRAGEQYGKSGPKADVVAAKRKATDLAAATELLHKVLQADSQNAHAHFFLGMALERSGKLADAVAEYRAALVAPAPEPAAGLYLAHALVKSRPGEAVKAARSAAQAYPQSTIARHMLMAALIANGEKKEAARIGQAMLGVDPADPLTTHLLGMATEKSESKKYARETERLLAGDESVKKAFETDVKWLSGE